MPALLHTCGNAITRADRYCPACGGRITDDKEVIHENIFTSRSMLIVLGYYCICFGVWLVIEYGDWVQDAHDFYVLHIVDAAITLTFALIGIKQLIPLYSFKNVVLKKVLLYSLAAVIGSIAINYITTLINISLFDSDLRFYPLFSSSEYPVAYMIALIAVYPALFEEMAFRGFMFNSVKNLAGGTNAVIVTSLLFAIVHFAFLSLFWLIPFALITARLRNKYNTLWYGMAIHFAFNLTACIIEIIN